MLNDGKGNFVLADKNTAPALENIGMVTDAAWADTDADGDPDLVLSLEWGTIKVLQNDGGKLRDISEKSGLEAYSGLWNCLQIADLDGDGDLDIIAGNHGKNSRLKAETDRPLTLHINDFDQNGSAEQILSAYNDRQSYPFVLRHDLIMQLPGLKKKYLKYENYRDVKIEDMFSAEELAGSVVLSANELQSGVFFKENNGYNFVPFPPAAQSAPLYSFAVNDFDADGNQEIVYGGNFLRSKPELGIYNASYGGMLRCDKSGNVIAVPTSESGIFIEGEIRDFALFSDTKRILAARNDAAVQIISYE